MDWILRNRNDFVNSKYLKIFVNLDSFPFFCILLVFSIENGSI